MSLPECMCCGMEITNQSYSALCDLCDTGVCKKECSKKLIQKIGDQRKALGDLVKKIDELSPHIDGFTQFCAIHNMPWTYGNWAKELKEARKVLRR